MLSLSKQTKILTRKSNKSNYTTIFNYGGFSRRCERMSFLA